MIKFIILLSALSGLPEPTTPPEAIMDFCFNHAGKDYGINPWVLKAISRVEGGKLGTVSKNSNGSFDLGPMQINTINLPEIKNKFPGVSWIEITYQPCVNVYAAAWLLRRHMDTTDDKWLAVGKYHSKTPKYRDRYLDKVKKEYNALVSKYWRNAD